MYLYLAQCIYIKHNVSLFRTPEYDSWGEESEDEDERNPAAYYMPQPYPMPAYGYPGYDPQVAPPPPVVLGFPFPAYYPPPPVYKGKGKKGKKGTSHCLLPGSVAYIEMLLQVY